jgi:hypothetical protein
MTGTQQIYDMTHWYFLLFHNINYTIIARLYQVRRKRSREVLHLNHLTTKQREAEAMWPKLLTGSTVGRLESLLLFLLGPGVGTEWCPSSKSPLTLLEGEVALLLLEPMESNFFYKK